VHFNIAKIRNIMVKPGAYKTRLNKHQTPTTRKEWDWFCVNLFPFIPVQHLTPLFSKTSFNLIIKVSDWLVKKEVGIRKRTIAWKRSVSKKSKDFKKMPHYQRYWSCHLCNKKFFFINNLTQSKEEKWSCLKKQV